MSCPQHGELVSLLQNAIFPKFDFGFDRPLVDKDFEDFRLRNKSLAEKVHTYTSDLSGVFDSLSVKERNNFILHIIIFCGENSVVSMWCSNSIRECCDSILSHLLVALNLKDILTLLITENCKIVKLIIEKLKPFLLKTSWKQFPTAVVCYSSLLGFLKTPYIDDLLPALLPSALIITDDFDVENKLNGIKCLHHIVRNSTSSALKDGNYDQVIFKTLEMGYYDKDVKLIPELTSCIIILLSKIYLHESKTFWKKWTLYDSFLDNYCRMMRIEVNNDVKKTLMICLPDVIEACGLSSVRFLKPLYTIFDEYAFSPFTVLESLKAIKTVSKVCLARGKDFIEVQIFFVLKIVYSVETYKSVLKEEIITSACIETLNEINFLCPSVLDDLVHSAEYRLLDSNIQCILEKVLESS